MAADDTCLVFNSACVPSFASTDTACPFNSQVIPECFVSWQQPVMCSKGPCAVPRYHEASIARSLLVEMNAIVHMTATMGVAKITRYFPFPLAADAYVFVYELGWFDGPTDPYWSYVPFYTQLNSDNQATELKSYQLSPDVPPTDPYAGQVVLWLRGQGSHGSTVAVDESPLNATMVRHGTTYAPIVSVEQPKYGGTSLNFKAIAGGAANSAGDWTTPSSSSYTLGTGDFTLECHVYVNASYESMLFDGRPVGAGAGNWPLLYLTGGRVVWWYVNGVTRITAATLATNTWYHIAVVRTAGFTKIYINGEVSGTPWADTTDYLGDKFIIGGSNDTTLRYGLNGWMDDVRITKAARYTAPFDIPDASGFVPYVTPWVGVLENDSSIDTNTFKFGDGALHTFDSPAEGADPFASDVVLFLRGNPAVEGGTTFTDESPINATITRQGTTYAPTTTLGIWKYGGSAIVFSSLGTGGANSAGNLLTPTSSGTYGFTGDFTLEAFVNLSSGTVGAIFDGRPLSSESTAPLFYLTSGRVLSYYVNGVLRITGPTLNTGQWYHVALCRASGNTRMFVEGVQVGVTWVDSTVYTHDRFIIGGWNAPSAANGINGRMDDMRITKAARYTANFLPPGYIKYVPPGQPASTDPYSQYVTLLCRGEGTNLSTTCVDSSAYNVSFTRWGTTYAPEVSTAQSKWGGSSLRFKSSGDGNPTIFDAGGFETPNNEELYSFGYGDFTIEFWVRLASTQSAASHHVCFDGRKNGVAGNQPMIFLRFGTGAVYYNVNGANVHTGSAGLAINTWMHVAVCRSGTSLRIFRDGVQEGSTYTDTTNYVCKGYMIGGNGASPTYEGLDGWLDDVRVTKYARYTANFTPPAAEFDIGTIGAITPRVKYLTDLTSKRDYVELIRPEVWTLEAWVYPTATASLAYICGTQSALSDATSVGWSMHLSNGFLAFRSKSGAYTGSSTLISITGNITVPLNQWSHVCVERDGATWFLYVNGVTDVRTRIIDIYAATIPPVGTAGGVQWFGIGSVPLAVPGESFVGYIDEVRITKGMTRYGGAFQAFLPPTVEGGVTQGVYYLRDGILDDVVVHLQGDELTNTTGYEPNPDLLYNSVLDVFHFDTSSTGTKGKTFSNGVVTTPAGAFGAGCVPLSGIFSNNIAEACFLDASSWTVEFWVRPKTAAEGGLVSGEEQVIYRFWDGASLPGGVDTDKTILYDHMGCLVTMRVGGLWPGITYYWHHLAPIYDDEGNKVQEYHSVNAVGTTYYNIPNGALDPGVWTWVVIQRSQNKLSIWMNGQQVSIDGENLFPTQAREIRIGTGVVQFLSYWGIGGTFQFGDGIPIDDTYKTDRNCYNRTLDSATAHFDEVRFTKPARYAAYGPGEVQRFPWFPTPTPTLQTAITESSVGRKKMIVVGDVQASTNAKRGFYSMAFGQNNPSTHSYITMGKIAGEYHAGTYGWSNDFAGTIEAWFKPTAYPANGPYGYKSAIWSNRLTSNTGGHEGGIYSATGTGWTGMYLHVANETTHRLYPCTINHNDWNWICVTKVSESGPQTVLAVYMNGVRLYAGNNSEPTFSQTSNNGTSQLRIGAKYTGGPNQFVGFIEDFRITGANNYRYGTGNSWSTTAARPPATIEMPRVSLPRKAITGTINPVLVQVNGFDWLGTSLITTITGRAGGTDNTTFTGGINGYSTGSGPTYSEAPDNALSPRSIRLGGGQGNPAGPYTMFPSGASPNNRLRANGQGQWHRQFFRDRVGTIEMTFRFNSRQTGSQQIFAALGCRINSALTYTWSWHLTVYPSPNNRLYFVWVDEASEQAHPGIYYSMDSGVAILDDTNYHVAVVFNTEEVRMYVNGVLCNTLANPAKIAQPLPYDYIGDNSAQVCLGSLNAYGGSYVSGNDHFVFNNFRLIEAEVYTGASFTPPTTPLPIIKGNEPEWVVEELEVLMAARAHLVVVMAGVPVAPDTPPEELPPGYVVPNWNRAGDFYIGTNDYVWAGTFIELSYQQVQVALPSLLSSVANTKNAGIVRPFFIYNIPEALAYDFFGAVDAQDLPFGWDMQLDGRLMNAVPFEQWALVQDVSNVFADPSWTLEDQKEQFWPQHSKTQLMLVVESLTAPNDPLNQRISFDPEAITYPQWAALTSGQIIRLLSYDPVKRIWDIEQGFLDIPKAAGGSWNLAYLYLVDYNDIENVYQQVLTGVEFDARLEAYSQYDRTDYSEWMYVSGSIGGRAARPMPPGRVRINGSDFWGSSRWYAPSEDFTFLRGAPRLHSYMRVTWSPRNRLQNYPLDFPYDASTAGSETDIYYIVDVYAGTNIFNFNNIVARFGPPPWQNPTLYTYGLSYTVPETLPSGVYTFVIYARRVVGGVEDFIYGDSTQAVITAEFRHTDHIITAEGEFIRGYLYDDFALPPDPGGSEFDAPGDAIEG